MKNNYNNGGNLCRIIRQRRLALSLTLGELAAASGVSPSHLGRIEKGERFPSARILCRIAKPLRFEEGEMFVLAGYLSTGLEAEAWMGAVDGIEGLDPMVAGVLMREPQEIQRIVIGILSLLKGISKSIA